MDQIIQKYEEISAKTCEVCGKPGDLGGKYWLSVTCNSCRKPTNQL